MDKASITKSLREYANGDWISKRQIRSYLGCGDSLRDSITDCLDYRISGRRILFFVPDVADQINRNAIHKNRV